jgi:glycosyltransferase involved in cell wall biosynthesis
LFLAPFCFCNREKPVPNFTLTVAICTHNRPDDLADLLEALYAQDLSGIQVVVVDSASRPDAHHSLVRTIAGKANLELIRLETPGVSAARNAGLEAARAPWLGFLDDDEIAASDWVAQAKRLIAAAPAICPVISGRIDLLFPSGMIPRIGPIWREFLGSIQDEGEGDRISDAKVGCGNAIFRCDALRGIGSFSEQLGRVGGVLLSGEEQLVVERLCEAGQHVFYSDRLRIDHKVSPERLKRQWAAKRAYWGGVTEQKIRRLMRRPIGILGVAKIAAKIPVLAMLAPVYSPAHEFFIRFWFYVGTIRELFSPVRLRPSSMPASTHRACGTLGEKPSPIAVR